MVGHQGNINEGELLRWAESCYMLFCVTFVITFQILSGSVCPDPHV